MVFDIWYYGQQTDIGYSKMKKAFEAGQQSKQAEIDALKEKINNVVRVVYNETDDYYIDEKIQEILHDA